MSLVSFRMVFASNQRFTFSVSDWRPDISLPVALWLGLDTHIPGHCRPAHHPGSDTQMDQSTQRLREPYFGKWVLLLEAMSAAVNILVFTTGWIGGLSDFAGQANSSDPGSFVFTVFFYSGILNAKQRRRWKPLSMVSWNRFDNNSDNSPGGDQRFTMTFYEIKTC